MQGNIIHSDEFVKPCCQVAGIYYLIRYLLIEPGYVQEEIGSSGDYVILKLYRFKVKNICTTHLWKIEPRINSHESLPGKYPVGYGNGCHSA